MDNRFKKTIENFRNYGRGRNYKVFAVFVLISTFFWFLIKFSIQYTVLSSYETEYVNIPDNLSWGEIEKHNVEIRTTASGFKHLNNFLVSKKVKIDLGRLRKGQGGDYYVLPKEQMGYINEQFPGSVNVNYQHPDSLHFDFSKKIDKKIPIILNDSVSLAKSFKFKTPIRLVPDSLIISGPQSIVSTISFVETNKFVKINISGNAKTKVYLNKIKDSRVDVSNDFVDVYLDVEKFTQNTIEIPISLINVPEGYILKTFPDNIKIVFNTGLSDFPSVNKATFKALIDYNKADSIKNLTIPVNIEVMSDKVELIKIEPSEVEYLLREIEEK